MALVQAGFAAVGLNGVWCAGTKDEKTNRYNLREELKAFELRGRKVYLAFDSDQNSKPEVRQALIRLFLLLASSGAEVLQLTTWDSTKAKGIDDWLVFNQPLTAAQSLQALIQNAPPFLDSLQPNVVDIGLVAKELARVEILAPVRAHLIRQLAKQLGIPANELKGHFETASEEALATEMGRRIGTLRCVGQDWFVCQDGVWIPRERSEFSPLALAVLSGLPESLRTQLRAKEVQAHLEMRSQIPRSTFCGAMHFGSDGEVMIAVNNGTLIIPAKEDQEIRLAQTDSELGFTIALPVSYNPKAAPTAFSRVLPEAVPDMQERDLFLDVLATALIPDC